jgi:phosphoribosylaminoimidazolecarboxamide formyltransferase/IMP cyclohydrolase
MPPCTRALISVSDKAGVVELATRLHQLKIEILSTGGTAVALRQAGLPVTDVADITGFPEIMDGRVKTLHPLIHGGLLNRGKTDATVMARHGIKAIDLLVVNLYPFEATTSRAGCTREDAIENIDIGGPAMIRGAAKNHDFVAVLVDPADYGRVLGELESDGSVSTDTRRYLARKAFAHTATYDATVWSWLRAADDDHELPARYPIGLRLRETLRYGENPHQRAGLYTLAGGSGDTVVGAQLHQGKELSFNNLADADAALECVRPLPAPACVIVKHANPCGVGLGTAAAAAYEKAYATDPTSAFGGIIAFNCEVDGALATTSSSGSSLKCCWRQRSHPKRWQFWPANRISGCSPPARCTPAGHRRCASSRSRAACWCRTATSPYCRPMRCAWSASVSPPLPNLPMPASPGRWCVR